MLDRPRWLAAFPDEAITAGLYLLAIIVALVAARLSTVLLGRLATRSRSMTDDVLLARVKRPLAWVCVAIALNLTERIVPLSDIAAPFWQQATAIVVPALIGWMAIALLSALSDILIRKADITAPDNLAARRRHTRIGILSKITALLIVFLTICMMLMTIPGVRTIGVTLIASAGLAGLAVGAAAQPALKNLIAGIQLAFTEPIRIDDVVIVAGEWGRVEEIRLTYVVLKLWDERRLVVPITKFLEECFQNWTRQTSALLGAVHWRLDPATDIGRLRAKFEDIVRANPRWDGRFFNLQVTDMGDETIEVRALMTAANADKTFDLRCDVREAMLAFVRAEMPEALPRRRQLQLGAANKSVELAS